MTSPALAIDHLYMAKQEMFYFIFLLITIPYFLCYSI